MPKLLYISYLYPPVGGSGVQRSYKFNKYLPEFGWQPIILTADYRWLNQPRDFNLEIPSGVPVYRSFAPDLRWLFKVFWGIRLPGVVRFLQRYCFIPDPERLWLPFAKRTIKRIFAEHKINFVLITAPPYAPLFLGKYLKRHYGVDYCVDYRDPWTSGVGQQYNPRPAWIAKRERRWEQQILQQAKHIICVNDTMIEVLQNNYPDLNPAKMHSITNGYDEADFSSLPANIINHNYLRIVYTGAFYDLRQPDIIWQALGELAKAGNIDPAKLRIEIYGHNQAGFVLGNYQKNPIITEIVSIKPYLSHPQSICELMQADALLLYSGSGTSEQMNSPAKLYEYLRSGKPILAIIDPLGAAANILTPANSSFIADSASLDSVKKIILQLYNAWLAKSLSVQPNWPYIRSFERRQLSCKLASILSGANPCAS